MSRHRTTARNKIAVQSCLCLDRSDTFGAEPEPIGVAHHHRSCARLDSYLREGATSRRSGFCLSDCLSSFDRARGYSAYSCATVSRPHEKRTQQNAPSPYGSELGKIKFLLDETRGYAHVDPCRLCFNGPHFPGKLVRAVPVSRSCLCGIKLIYIFPQQTSCG